jgi:hypothetical protein
MWQLTASKGLPMPMNSSRSRLLHRQTWQQVCWNQQSTFGSPIGMPPPTPVWTPRDTLLSLFKRSQPAPCTELPRTPHLSLRARLQELGLRGHHFDPTREEPFEHFQLETAVHTLPGPLRHIRPALTSTPGYCLRMTSSLSQFRKLLRYVHQREAS